MKPIEPAEPTKHIKPTKPIELTEPFLTSRNDPSTTHKSDTIET